MNVTSRSHGPRTPWRLGLAAAAVTGLALAWMPAASAAASSTACFAFGTMLNGQIAGSSYTFTTGYYFAEGETVSLSVGPYAGTPTQVTLEMPTGTLLGSTTTVPGTITYLVTDDTTPLAGAITVTGGLVRITASCTPAGGGGSNDFGPVTGTVDVSHTAGVEGDTLTATGMFGDPDGTWLGEITKVSGEGSLIDNGDGTWAWSLPTRDNGSGRVTVQASDGVHSPAALEIFNWSAANGAPVVSAVVSSSVGCRTSAALTVNFTDAGAGDGPWMVGIDWGDGSAATTFLAPAAGMQDARAHVYTTPGTYNPEVTVTDKDAATGMKVAGPTSVNQTYDVDFLAPIAESTDDALVPNALRTGRTIPIKATLYDQCALESVTNPSTPVTLQTSTVVDAFRWSTKGFWISNLDTGALDMEIGSLYRLDIYVGPVKATETTWAVLEPTR